MYIYGALVFKILPSQANLERTNDSLNWQYYWSTPVIPSLSSFTVLQMGLATVLMLPREFVQHAGALDE